MSYLSDLLGTSYKEGMTEEDISNALEKLNKNSTSEADKLKIQLSKANSEAAEYKKQLRAKQTDDEAAAAETKAAIEKLMAENAELKKSMDIANDVLDDLHRQKMSKSDFARAMGVSPQRVTTLLSGREKMNPEIISKMEEALRVTLVHTGVKNG